MHLPIPVTALPGGPAPMHYPLRDVGATSTSSIVWALICIVVWASLLGLAALLAARRRADSGEPPPALRAVPSPNDHLQRRPHLLTRAA